MFGLLCMFILCTFVYRYVIETQGIRTIIKVWLCDVVANIYLLNVMHHTRLFGCNTFTKKLEFNDYKFKKFGIDTSSFILIFIME